MERRGNGQPLTSRESKVGRSTSVAKRACSTVHGSRIPKWSHSRPKVAHSRINNVCILRDDLKPLAVSRTRVRTIEEDPVAIQARWDPSSWTRFAALPSLSSFSNIRSASSRIYRFLFPWRLRALSVIFLEKSWTFRARIAFSCIIGCFFYN